MDAFTLGISLLCTLTFRMVADACVIYRDQTNVTYDTNSCYLVNVDTDNTPGKCLELCEQNSTCTGAFANSEENTTWCCLTSEETIGYAPGNFVLFYKLGRKTKCLFGFDADCSGCISDTMWNGYYGSAVPDTYVNFRITLSGTLCSQISGFVLNAGAETAIEWGHLDRVTKKWHYQAVAPASSIFNADMDDTGSMVSGTILQPTGATYVYYATYSSN